MKCVDIIKNGGIAVIATDTIYGIVASALNQDAVERVYCVKGRAPEKPCIILISSIADIAEFGTSPNSAQREVLKKVWPGAVSVILPCKPSLTYLHRGTRSLAFRLPKDEDLLSFLKETGPLIAPSANLEGKAPAKDIEEARAYFKDEVDCYLDGGVRDGLPSRLISLNEQGGETILRK